MRAKKWGESVWKEYLPTEETPVKVPIQKT